MVWLAQALGIHLPLILPITRATSRARQFVMAIHAWIAFGFLGHDSLRTLVSSALQDMFLLHNQGVGRCIVNSCFVHAQASDSHHPPLGPKLPVTLRDRFQGRFR